MEATGPGLRVRTGDAVVPSLLRSASRVAGGALITLALLITAGWGTLALYYFDHLSFSLRTALASAFALAALGAFVGCLVPQWRWRALAAYLVLFAGVWWWWFSLAPSNDRGWQPSVAVLPYAVIAGNVVTVHNIRNFDYRSETDFTPAYYDRTFDLRKLVGVDLVSTYWMGHAIAHILLSFEFQGGKHLAISIETRSEHGESYSTIKGFFRQYELYYVVADERDVIRLRTNYRKNPPEEVYLYRVNGSIKNERRLFLQYMDRINSLKIHPEWYNALTTNCTTVVWMNTRINPTHPPFSWKILASGYLPEYLYELGLLDTHVPFPELQRLAHINARARAADRAPDFSRRIRAGIPGEGPVDSKKKGQPPG